MKMFELGEAFRGIRLKNADPFNLYIDEPIGREMPDILYYLKVWTRMARILRSLHILLGILATIFSILAVSQIGVTDEYAKVFAFISAVSIALMTAFNLGGKSNNTRAAWRQLNAAVMKFNVVMKAKEGINGIDEENKVIQAL